MGLLRSFRFAFRGLGQVLTRERNARVHLLAAAAALGLSLWLGLARVEIELVALARFLVPGRDPMGCLGTILLGVVGSFVGGFLWELIQFHRFELRPIGFIGSVVGAVVVLLLRRLVAAR